MDVHHEDVVQLLDEMELALRVEGWTKGSLYRAEAAKDIGSLERPVGFCLKGVALFRAHVHENNMTGQDAMTVLDRIANTNLSFEVDPSGLTSSDSDEYWYQVACAAMNAIRNTEIVQERSEDVYQDSIVRFNDKTQTTFEDIVQAIGEARTSVLTEDDQKAVLVTA